MTDYPTASAAIADAIERICHDMIMGLGSRDENEKKLEVRSQHRSIVIYPLVVQVCSFFIPIHIQLFLKLLHHQFFLNMTTAKKRFTKFGKLSAAMK
jgi:hypothetical protein